MLIYSIEHFNTPRSFQLLVEALQSIPLPQHTFALWDSQLVYEIRLDTTWIENFNIKCVNSIQLLIQEILNFS